MPIMKSCKNCRFYNATDSLCTRSQILVNRGFVCSNYAETKASEPNWEDYEMPGKKPFCRSFTLFLIAAALDFISVLLVAVGDESDLFAVFALAAYVGLVAVALLSIRALIKAVKVRNDVYRRKMNRQYCAMSIVTAIAAFVWASVHPLTGCIGLLVR